ncbi:MAG: ABC transporter ATP-binding protein [Lachnospiraceae bacterium]|nr:ABC transporter ATP-binding protein [Lachnospiraceae bacterium]
MKKLLKHMKGYGKECVLAPLFKMLEAIFELFVPLIMARIIDFGIGNQSQPYVLKMCGILIALGVIGLTCSITAQYFAARAAVGFATRLRHLLFSHVQSLSFSDMDQVGTSTLITRMTSDINQVQNGVNMVLRLFLRSPFIVFGAMIMAFTIDVKAAMIFVVIIPLLSIVVFGIMAVSIPLYRKVQTGLDRVLKRTRENLTGARVIRAFGKEDTEFEEFQESNQALVKMQIFVGKISALMNPVTYVMINIALVVLIWTGALRVNAGDISQGEVVALVNYISQILVELIKLANLIVTITKALACANRVQSVMDIEPEMPKYASERKVNNLDCDTEAKINIPEENNQITFEHVSLTYKGAGAESLTDIDFEIKKGDTFGIIGGTGSGKSSVVNLIPRFYDVTKGRVLVNGKDVRDYDLNALRSKIGMVMQNAVLFSGTIRQNLLWGNPQADDKQLWEALEIAQAKEFVEQKSKGLDEVIEQGGKNLSGGQRQRLTIARALVRKPEIIIMDDSASALDYATDAKLRQAITNLEDSMTVIIVSQRASSVRTANQILVLDDGAAAGLGTSDELLKTCKVYKEIYGSQFKIDKKGGAAV